MKHDKLVRDKIPEIIKATNQEAIAHIADTDEYYAKLKSKLLEEVNEFLEENETEELADILEVIYALCDYKQISFEQLENIRVKKVKERGAFRKKIILDEVK